jgi:XTP/dITP diphosphohydrolase
MIKIKNVEITKIMLATSNAGKIRELRDLFKHIPVKIVSIKDVFTNTPEEPEEYATTFAGNARIKSEYYDKLSNIPCIADDSGMMVDALNGAPGIYSHRFAATPYNPNPTDDEKNAKVIELLKEKNLTESAAKYVCSVSLYIPSINEEIAVTGVLNGRFKSVPSGKNGFSFDKHFYLSKYNYTKTAADISSKEKNKISHRSEAMRKLLAEI